MSPFTKFLFQLQEITQLILSAFGSLFRRPRYYSEAIKQMDIIGVGSLPIIILTGFFTGGVLALQTYPTLAYFGGQSQTGRLVAFTLIRELGPVLAALMVAGRMGSAIAAELGSMVVSQQIDAMRAFGTNPTRKLVAPRIVALVLMLPLLTVAADLFGIIGGGVVGKYIYELPVNVYVTSVRDGISVQDIVGGVIKPLVFGLIIGSISCYKGLNTTGGTVGVGRSTTNAVVTSSIVVIIADFFLSKGLQELLESKSFG